MPGPGRFDADIMPLGASENYVNPPTLSPNKTGLPYSNASNHILRMTLAARDEVRELKNELDLIQVQILEDLMGQDIASLTPRP